MTALELHDMQAAIWVPALRSGTLGAAEPGVILAQKAADDLGVRVGDHITLEHPRREGLLAFRMVQTELPVIGIHDNPIRALSYMDLSGASLMGLEGVTNLIVLEPPDGVGSDIIKQQLLTQPGVASVEPIADFTEAIQNQLSLILSVLGTVAVVVLIMALMIAFNATSISVDERRREIATMFAFGLRLRTVTRMQMLENAIIGALGMVIGMPAGVLALLGLLNMRNPDFEEVRLVFALSPLTLLVAFGVGVVVVALTPLLSLRRLRRMDIPSTLRVME